MNIESADNTGYADLRYWARPNGSFTDTILADYPEPLLLDPNKVYDIHAYYKHTVDGVVGGNYTVDTQLTKDAQFNYGSTTLNYIMVDADVVRDKNVIRVDLTKYHDETSGTDVEDTITGTYYLNSMSRPVNVPDGILSVTIDSSEYTLYGESATLGKTISSEPITANEGIDIVSQAYRESFLTDVILINQA